MLTDWELWAVANHLVEEHGEGARGFAAMRRDALAAARDRAGAEAWDLIIERIQQLQAKPSGALQ
ncbi:MAG: hypothetical protein JWP15_1217 [Alphaproteobacteria bacterium]|nr:hypothetical protein [Alphaproteobacteria bacterium]